MSSWSDWSKEPALTYDIQGQVVPKEEQWTPPEGSTDFTHRSYFTEPLGSHLSNIPTEATGTIPASAPSAGVVPVPPPVPESLSVEENVVHHTTLESFTL